MTSSYEHIRNRNNNYTDEEIGMISPTTPKSTETCDGDIENENENDDTHDDSIENEFGLIESLVGSRAVRTRALKKKGFIIDSSVKSNTRWMRTVFVLRERAIGNFFVPWLLVTLNAVAWTIILHIYPNRFNFSLGTAESLYNLVLTTALAFLLVFRLNRVAIRWWETRSMWGMIVADARTLTSSLLEHTNHAPKHRDDAISWLACFVISIKQLLRDDTSFDSDEVAGFISPQRLIHLKEQDHKGLYLAGNLRHSLKNAFQITDTTPVPLSVAYTSEMRLMDSQINDLIVQMGGLERVRSTPLPIIYVTHLRTFLMVYLLSMPYMYGHLWGFGTIPAVVVTSFILLGIDNSAAECESPFRLRSNHLPMETFCIKALNDIEDLYNDNAHRRQMKHDKY